MSTDISEIQSQDNVSLENAVEGLIQKKRERRRRRDDLSVEAAVRDLLNLCQEVLSVDQNSAEPLLDEIHTLIVHDEDLDKVVSASSTLLQESTGIDDDTARQIKAQFRRNRRRRARDRTPPNPEREYVALMYIAKALDYYSSITDLTPYAPVRLEALDIPGTTNVDTPTPVGRRRLPKDTKQDLDEASVEIPHESCDHILVVAVPRRGKDSTIASLGLNLQREHGYKYISVFDDGRMETPMLAIPSDDKGIRQNLDRFDQGPRAFDAQVFVPSTPDVPEKLPANFQRFTIGIDSLTPHLILRLAGVTSSDPTVEDRIERALEMTVENTGDVPELVARLNKLAVSQDVEIEWSEQREKGSGATTETYEAHYSVPASKAIKKAAQRLANLAGRGIVAGTGASTNIDMPEIIRDQERAAVLCCNFMSEGQEALKFVLIDLWLRMVYRTRDEYPRLPRVALELRELKNLAPSKIGDVRHSDAIKTLRQTIFFISTNGGSRRVLMLGSTQKLNDVYKPIRTNMATKILLQLGEEEIQTLDRSYNFSWEQQEQLSSFKVGMGMLIAEGDKFYPIEWRGAPCGLGVGDEKWLDRYGRAWGARVASDDSAFPPRGHRRDSWWVHVPDLEKYAVNERTPNVGEQYAEWYLLESDFPDDVDRSDVDRDLVNETLEQRREYSVEACLNLVSSGEGTESHTLHEEETESRTETAEMIVSKHNLPIRVTSWFVGEDGRINGGIKLANSRKILRAIEAGEFETLAAVGEQVDLNYHTVGDHLREELKPCVSRDGEYFTITEAGERVLNTDLDEVANEIERKLREHAEA